MTSSVGPNGYAQFWRDGYVILRPEGWAKAVRAVGQDIFDIFRQAGAAIAPDAVITDPDAHQALGALFAENFESYYGAAKLANHLISVHRAGTSQVLEAALRELGLEHPSICARPVVWFHAPFLAKTTRYHRLPAHQEWSNMQGSLDGAVVWTPLLPISDAMGRLEVAPGSHARGLLPILADDDQDYALGTRGDAIEDAFTPLDVPVGAVLVFSPFLLHRSGENRSDLARITMNFRFNNAADPSFIGEHYLNPFHYAAPSELISTRRPSEADLSTLIQRRLNARRHDAAA